MKIDIPFNDSRKDVLYRYYRVQPKPAPVHQLSGKELLRVSAACLLLAVLGAVLVILWPIGERVSR